MTKWSRRVFRITSRRFRFRILAERSRLRAPDRRVGSDHAWGNHMFVMGGSVVGGDFYGSLRPDGSGAYFPTLTPGGTDDTDTGTSPRGRWIPTTSVDQYASVLARWFGLPQDTPTLQTVFPNLANFSASNPQLGFLP